MAEPKKMKSSVRFRRGAMTRECGVCEHWQRPKSCAWVVGEVSADFEFFFGDENVLA